MTPASAFDGLSVASMILALIPCSLFLANLLLYRPPPQPEDGTTPAISVLIPARNEAAGIADAIDAVLASTGVQLELIVMDDSSTDATAAIVSKIAQNHPLLRLEQAPPLPSGWNGKQHTCWVLAHAASHDLLCFLDADVRLAPAALSGMSAFLTQSHADLVSGFPRQITLTPLEWLLLPLIHFILLGLLPFAGMRRSLAPGFAAGCGQFFLTRRSAYLASGGHAAIRDTRHDGLLLPRLFRHHGFRTDLADLTPLASCRMYTSAREVWLGLAKNATEGLAAPSRILPLTMLLLTGQVLPIFLLATVLLRPSLRSTPVLLCLTAACFASLLPRLLATHRFRQPLRSAILHPVGILVLLTLEWWALFRQLRGRSVTWKTRSYTTTSPSSGLDPSS